ncbi:MAG: RnfABCDGE type electron transport complex subunit B [Oscillospiraceae bacterium]
MEMLQQIGVAMAVLGGLGAFFGLVLAMANRVFYVQTDPRLDRLVQALPGANCGGCGFSGCGAYAQAVLDGKAPVGLCVSGGDACAQTMASVMGVKAEKVARQVAFVRCAGSTARDKGIYEGFPTAWPPPRWRGVARSSANLVAWALATAPRHVSLTPFTWNKAWPRWTRTSAPAA